MDLITVFHDAKFDLPQSAMAIHLRQNSTPFHQTKCTIFILEISFIPHSIPRSSSSNPWEGNRFNVKLARIVFYTVSS